MRNYAPTTNTSKDTYFLEYKKKSRKIFLQGYARILPTGPLDRESEREGETDPYGEAAMLRGVAAIWTGMPQSSPLNHRMRPLPIPLLHRVFAMKERNRKGSQTEKELSNRHLPVQTQDWQTGSGVGTTPP